MSESKKPELFKKGSAIFVSNSHLVNHPNSSVSFYFFLLWRYSKIIEDFCSADKDFSFTAFNETTLT